MLKIFFTATVMLLLLSCNEKNECSGNCDTVFPELIFKIVNSGDQNLTCGPNKIYTSDKIQFKSVLSGTLTDEAKTFSGDSTSAATGIVLITSGLSSQYYLYLNNVKTDSLQFTYQTFAGKTECCSNYHRVTQVKLNNALITSPYTIVK